MRWGKSRTFWRNRRQLNRNRLTSDRSATPDKGNRQLELAGGTWRFCDGQQSSTLATMFFDHRGRLVLSQTSKLCMAQRWHGFQTLYANPAEEQGAIRTVVASAGTTIHFTDYANRDFV